MTQRTATNFVIDAIAFVAFVLLTATGLVERYLLPPGTGRFQSLWGMNRHQWGEIHFWIALVLMGALATHILLHWKWIVRVIRGKQAETSGWRVALGVVGLFGLVGLSLAPFLATVEQTGQPGRGPERQAEIQRDDAAAASHGEIRGSMTLAEVEQQTGVPVTVIIRELGLPSDVPRDENLGRLQRQFSFDLQDVRRIVKEEKLTQ
jgi:hypothetical protein